MLIFRSVRSIVIAPANTGSESKSRSAVINTAHVIKVMCMKVIFSLRILIMVVIKLIAPRMEDTPARCKEKIAKSTDGPLCEILEDRGG